MKAGEDNEDDFIFENINRYKLSVYIGNDSAMQMSDQLDDLVSIYDKIVQENITNIEHVVVSIFDYDKNTSIYYYNSEHEQ